MRAIGDSGARVGVPVGAGVAGESLVPDPGGVAPARRMAAPRMALIAGALVSIALGAWLFLALEHRPSPTVARGSGYSRAGLLSLPLGAQGPVSAALGADSPAYRVTAAPRGFAAVSPEQHLRSDFSRSGIAVSAGSARLGLSLRSIGYGEHLSPLGAVSPRAHANRVTYVRPGISESYVNGPLGLEQGFTLSRAPAGRPDGPLTLSIALSGDTSPTLAGAHGLVLSRNGTPALRITGLAARDARGHSLRSWFELEGGRLLLRVDPRGARYPVGIDPFVQQGKKLPGGPSTRFGYRVALSADGNTALIGGPWDNGDNGAAWVFTRSGSVWTQQGEKLTGTGTGEASGTDEFGRSVALSSDGNTAVVGAPLDNLEAGAAWVFTRSGSTWTKQGGKLTGAGGVKESDFGEAVALSGDGATALVGGYDDNGQIGAAWVFVRKGKSWSAQGPKLTAFELVPKGSFGYSVALSEDGSTALIGSLGENANAGAAYVFTRVGGSWTHQARLTGAGEVGAGWFGESVALSAGGDTAVVGGPGDNGKVGAAWVFTRSGATWTQQGAKLTATGESGEGKFGISSALSADGNSLLIGAKDDGAPGAAYVFARAGGEWLQEGSKLTGGETVGAAQFGASVALSSNADTALVGGFNDNTAVGAAWAFEYKAGPAVVTGAATEVTTTAATLDATVNPKGSNVTKCEFEYGTTTAYGKTAACSVLPGSGEAPVGVSGAIAGLTDNTAYHFRVAATNANGTSLGVDRTLTTLLTSKSGETPSEAKPAEAKEGEISVVASSGTGSVTVGPYGSEIGGVPLSNGTGQYFDVYRGVASSFKDVEIKDCELGGGRTLWWYNPAGGWEPISEPPAHYTEGPKPCISVTITENTRPDVAQLTGTRFGTRFGADLGALVFGKCVPMKKGKYTAAGCLTSGSKGSYEWEEEIVKCLPAKGGYYLALNAKGECEGNAVKKGKPKGKYESTSASFTSTGKVATFAIQSIGTLECKSSTATGSFTSPKTGLLEELTFQKCKLGEVECSNTNQAGAIRAESPIEIFLGEEAGQLGIEYFKEPIMAFLCGGEAYRLHGRARGELLGGLREMSRTREAKFDPVLAYQELETSDGKGEQPTTMTATFTYTGAQESEITPR